MAPCLLFFLGIVCTAATQTGISPRNICQSSCSGDLGENIFPNGDFGQGIPNILSVNPGIAPGYSYTLSPPPNDGSYTITNNTTNWGSFAATSWINIEDNGPEPNGYMMVFNASYQPGLFYQKQVQVCENTLYEFSMDVISMNDPVTALTFIKPNVAFEIDGNTVCATDNIAIDAKWHTYRFSFLTDPGVTQVTLSLRNDAPGGIGNDLAIDNISFRACGPEINVPVTAVFCAGQPITLHADLANSPYATTYYQWQSYDPGSNMYAPIPGGNAADQIIGQPADGNQYRLVVASNANNLSLSNCRAVSQPVELMLEDLSGFAITGTDTTICNRAPAVLDAGNFVQYQWSTGASTSSIEVLNPGWVAVTVTTTHGCTAIDSLYAYEVTLRAAASAENPDCPAEENGQISVLDLQGGIGAVVYSINNFAPQQQTVFDSLRAGDYVVTVADSLGCRLEMPVSLYDPPPVSLSVGSDQDIRVCDSLTLSATSDYVLRSYLWQPPVGLSCLNCPTPIAMPMQSTTYSLQVTDERGCPDVDSIRITVLPRLDVYAPNIFKQDISNNDPNNFFTLYTSKSVVRIRRLDMYDRWGELVFQQINTLPGAVSLHWDGSDFRGRLLDEGVFFWLAEIEFSDGVVRPYHGDVTLIRRSGF